MDNTLNLNSAQCLKEANGFTATTITNICNGEVHVVPYGAADYLIAIPILMIVVLVAGVIWMIYKMTTCL